MDKQSELQTEPSQSGTGSPSLSILYSRIDVAPISPDIRRHSPLQNIPCANLASVSSGETQCAGVGTSRCSGCTIVAYCSKSCQKQHWLEHKRLCRDKLNNVSWWPAFMRPGSIRAPSFVSEKSEQEQLAADSLGKSPGQRPFGTGLSFWGNMPATDILNLVRNEGQVNTSDLCIAFAASGDLRNVIRTVNCLPDDYAGRLQIVINDRSEFITLRNTLLLLVLTLLPDKLLAVDIAIHLWYSSFLPEHYEAEVFNLVEAFLEAFTPPQGQNWAAHIQLTDTTTMTCSLSSFCLDILKQCRNSTYSRAEAEHEMRRNRFTPEGQDHLHRELFALSLPHRLAFLHFRTHGILLPCSAAMNDFTCPNRFLFSPDGGWMVSEGGNPLGSWDGPSYIAAGIAHGARSEDIYGCLYFYLRDELSKFATKLSYTKIQFAALSVDATHLTTVPAVREMRFDRVDVSNIMDVNYVGIKPVVNAWGPLLSDSPHATLLGYFMNWRAFFEEAAQPPREASNRLISKLREEKKMPPVPEARLLCVESVTAVYNNAHVFEKYLQLQEMDEFFLGAGLRRRKVHRVNPHRLSAPLDGSPHDLPVFADYEDWYLKAYITGTLWTERFVEIERVRG